MGGYSKWFGVARVAGVARGGQILVEVAADFEGVAVLKFGVGVALSEVAEGWLGGDLGSRSMEQTKKTKCHLKGPNRTVRVQY